MIDRLAADATLLLHLAFIAFVVFGAALALRWPWFAVVHLPAAAWGVWIELSSGTCPLTLWENRLRARAGDAGYAESFVEHYLLAMIYPAGLTPRVQWLLAGTVLIVNGALYAWILRRRRMSHNAGQRPPPEHRA